MSRSGRLQSNCKVSHSHTCHSYSNSIVLTQSCLCFCIFLALIHVIMKQFSLQVEAIQQKRTIAFINHYITHTASFLNRFSCVCEEKLEHLSNRIQNLEITLSLLETKVNLIPHMQMIMKG